MVDLQFQIQLQCFVSLYFVDAGSSQNVKRGVSGAEGTEKPTEPTQQHEFSVLNIYCSYLVLYLGSDIGKL